MSPPSNKTIKVYSSQNLENKISEFLHLIHIMSNQARLIIVIIALQLQILYNLNTLIIIATSL